MILHYIFAFLVSNRYKLVLIIEHLENLEKGFDHYFKDLNFQKFAWVQNPFIDDAENIYELTTLEREQFIEISCDTSLKQKFETEPLHQLWLQMTEEYKSLSSKAALVFLPFVTSYLCETGFSALAALKSKYRARLAVEKELRVAVSSLTPRFEKLCASKQSHVSH